MQTRHDNGWTESQETSYTYTLKPDTIRKIIEFNGEVAAVCETVNEYNSATDLPVASIHKCKIGDFESAECRIDTEYDRLGHIAQIKRPIDNGVADVKYCYNMHGWLTGIKGGRFEQQILFETGSGKPQYSGNISSVVWRNGRNGNRSYCFTYDTLNRLEKGEYTDVNSSATEEAANYGESVTYDSNGNITGLVRHGKQIDHSFGVVDTLSVSYSGNRIIGVEKLSEVMPTANSLGIRQGSHDFAYNAVRAITQDGTRGITDIEYDLNGNPIRIQFNNGGVTKYLYSIDGQKLQTIHLNAPPNIHVESGCKFDAIEDTYLQADTTTYFFGGNLIYSDGKFKRYLFEGGYIDARYRNVDEPESNLNLIETEDPEDIAPLFPNGENNSVIEPSTSADSPNMPSGLDFRFYIKDHLGNNREVIGMDGKIKQRTDYYPFGTPIQDLGFGLAHQPYAYNGKEFDTTHGLNTHDYGARQYNTALPRWDRIDPLCEKYYHISPYAYCFNNPVNAIDPDGMQGIAIHGTWSGPNTWKDQKGIEDYLRSKFNNTICFFDFKWDGGNYKILRTLAAEKLVHQIKMRYRDGLSIEEPITLVGHSHGGNVAIEAINKIVEMDEFKNIRINLVTINTPVRDDYQLTESARERGSHYNIYDSKDPVQTKGGNSWFTFPAKPSKVKLTGEYGNARREFDKGATNIRVNNPQGILGDFHNSHNRTNDWINRKKEQAIDSTKF